MAVQIQKIYSLGEFRLEPDKKLLTRDGVTVHLANRPFQVLLYLIENRDRMVSRAELLDLFWDGKDVYENTLTKCVGAIRKALDDTLEQPRFIETQWAKGYRYIGSLEESFSQAPRASLAEIERTRGYRLVVEEEYVEISPNEGAPARSDLLDEKTATTLAAQIAKAPRVNRSRRVIVLASALTVLLAICWLALRDRRDSIGARGGAIDATPSPIRSIAVLPLKNLSNDATSDYFSDGLTETFITELSKIDGLKVISRNSVFTYKDKEVDPREVGKRLDVAAVLEGSVRWNGDTVRVDVRLVNTVDGGVIWSGRSYDRALKDILAVQDEIACSVAAGLRVRLCGEADTANRYTTNVAAYQAYLEGRYFWNKRSAEGIKRSIEHFERAIAMDPDYALAYAGLADSYIQGVWHIPLDPKEALPKAKAAALRAIKIDEQLAEAHTALATVYQMEWRWTEAEKEIDRAIALNPGLARAYHVQTFHLDMTGRHEEAAAAIRQAQTLDPLNLVIGADMPLILMKAGHTEVAVSQALKVIEMDPDFAFGHQKLFELYLYQGNEQAAAEAYLKSLSLNGESDAVMVAYRNAHEREGLRGIYQKELERLFQNQLSGDRRSPIHIAWLYAGLGQKELAFKYLEVAYRERSAEIGVVKNYVGFAPLHSDPRYQNLLRRIGLAS